MVSLTKILEATVPVYVLADTDLQQEEEVGEFVVKLLCESRHGAGGINNVRSLNILNKELKVLIADCTG